jgi:myo-inositol-1(or 4)-monophosphatase
MSPILQQLEDLLRRAGNIAQEEREKMSREFKGDGSIVTNADRAVETFLREQLPRLVPGTTVWGEEFGMEEPGPEGLWVVDPVDGTTNFSFFSPLWGVTAALVKGDQILLGSVHLPDLSETFSAEAGQGALKNGEAMPPIPPGPIQPYETVSYDEVLFGDLPKSPIPGKMRCSGSFVVDGVFTACQRFRGMIGRRERLYDIAACVLMASELQADIRYADGSEFKVAELLDGAQIVKPWIIFPRDSGFIR